MEFILCACLPQAGLPAVAGLCEKKKNKNLSYLFKLNFKV
jgi:hypothetical protein